MDIRHAFSIPAGSSLPLGSAPAPGIVREENRKLTSFLPRYQYVDVRHSFAGDKSAPSRRLILKIAETKEELEGCFTVLHDAYVERGLMKPDPSGMRVTIYHALPTTTMLCAKVGGEVVGTLSVIRESLLGFPLQQIFDLAAVREKGGQIAEVSALAVHRKFRNTSGRILLPLMKFMCECCITFFDTRHLVIAVNPSHIDMYESRLFFRRLTGNAVEGYDFVNGAPAIVATLDLSEAPEVFRKHYSSKPASRNLHAYFTKLKLPKIRFPNCPNFTANVQQLTPELLDHFFNVRTQIFENLSERTKAEFHSIYSPPEYRSVLPALAVSQDDIRPGPLSGNQALPMSGAIGYPTPCLSSRPATGPDLRLPKPRSHLPEAVKSSR